MLTRRQVLAVAAGVVFSCSGRGAAAQAQESARCGTVDHRLSGRRRHRVDGAHLSPSGCAPVCSLTILVENKPGAAARLVGEYVKNAEPDGSVLLYTPEFPITVYPHSFRSLNYDSVRDFVPVSPGTSRC